MDLFKEGFFMRQPLLESRLMKFAKIFGITWDIIRLSKEPKADVRELRFSWARQVFALLRLRVKVIGQAVDGVEPMIFVGNHTSYVDIAICFHAIPSCCFVSKDEVRFWPVIGQAAVRAESIFVKRESAKSRSSARSQILEALLKDKKNLVIFPSGTTTLGPSLAWKKGAFEIAHQGKIKMQPFRVKYSPERDVAYIGDDFFPTHMIKLIKNPVISAQIEFGEPFLVQDVQEDLSRAKAWCEAPVSL